MTRVSAAVLQYAFTTYIFSTPMTITTKGKTSRGICVTGYLRQAKIVKLDITEAAS